MIGIICMMLAPNLAPLAPYGTYLAPRGTVAPLGAIRHPPGTPSFNSTVANDAENRKTMQYRSLASLYTVSLQ